MSDRYKIFFNTLVLYASTLALGIFSAYRHTLNPASVIDLIEFTPIDIVIFCLVFGIFTWLMITFGRMARVSLSLFWVVAILAGSQYAFESWLVWPWNFIAALALVVLIRIQPRVILHNLGMIIGISGLATLMGLSVTPIVAAIILCVLSIYDIVSVYKTKHMVTIAGQMLQSGSVFGFLVPARLTDFFGSVRESLDERRSMLLGSGDIGLPLVLVTSAVYVSLGAAIVTAGASLIGLMTMQWLFIHQEKPAPMAALPPIAASAILGYLLAILLRI